MSNNQLKFEDQAFRPSILSELPGLLFGLTIVVAAIPVAVGVADATGVEKALLLSFPLALLGMAIALRSGWKCCNKRFCLCDMYVSLYSGLLSPHLKTTRVLYQHVRGVEIEQTLLQRVLGLGDLHVGTDISHGEGKLVICGLSNPEKVKDILLLRVQKKIDSLGQGEGPLRQAM